MTVPESTGRILLDLAVILLAARAGGLLFARVGQPAVIGEIAAGVALGPTLLGTLPGDPSSELFPPCALDVLRVIGQLGLVLFMFGVEPGRGRARAARSGVVPAMSAVSWRSPSAPGA